MGTTLDALFDVLDSESARPAVYTAAGGGWVSRGQLLGATSALRRGVEGLRLPPGSRVWVAARDPSLQLVGVLGSLSTTSCAVTEADDRPPEYDVAARSSRPAAVVTDDPTAGIALWARARDIPVLPLGMDALTAPDAWRGRVEPAAGGTALGFFTSGTTSAPKAVPVGLPRLLPALRGVARRVELGPDDVSLSVAPLTHVLGLVTSALAALLAGGGVAFGDLTQPRPLGEVICGARPTWCAASPSALRLVLYAVRRGDVRWPGLRFLRSASAPLSVDWAAELEDFFDVPVLQAYAMTEAPGEIAGEGLGAGDRRRGTVGRPTLCQVEIRSDDAGCAVGEVGEVWIRGPNVVVEAIAPDAPAGAGLDGRDLPWVPTGDLGALDDSGFLRLRGRVNDVINQGGLKIAPAEVEAAALELPGVGAAVAFPVPHETLGQAVGLAVVPRDGAALDRGAVRRFLASRLSRRKLPAAIVICDEIPTSRRGKIVRRTLHAELRLA